jgi:hypothetical protein
MRIEHLPTQQRAHSTRVRSKSPHARSCATRCLTSPSCSLIYSRMRARAFQTQKSALVSSAGAFFPPSKLVGDTRQIDLNPSANNAQRSLFRGQNPFGWVCARANLFRDANLYSKARAASWAYVRAVWRAANAGTPRHTRDEPHS